MLHTYQMKASECSLDDIVPVSNAVKMNIIGLNSWYIQCNSINISPKIKISEFYLALSYIQTKLKDSSYRKRFLSADWMQFAARK